MTAPLRFVGLAGRIEKVIVAFSRVGARDQDEVGCVVDQARASGELGVTGIVQHIRAGEMRRNERFAHDFVPIETQAGFD